MRNFGVGSQAGIGATTSPAPLSRGGGPREPIQLAGKTSRPANSRGANPELLIAMERATKWFLIGAAFLIGGAFAAFLFVVSLVIDYGVSDSPF